MAFDDKQQKKDLENRINCLKKTISQLKEKKDGYVNRLKTPNSVTQVSSNKYKFSKNINSLINTTTTYLPSNFNTHAYKWSSATSAPNAVTANNNMNTLTNKYKITKNNTSRGQFSLQKTCIVGNEGKSLETADESSHRKVLWERKKCVAQCNGKVETKPPERKTSVCTTQQRQCDKILSKYKFVKSSQNNGPLPKPKEPATSIQPNVNAFVWRRRKSLENAPSQKRKLLYIRKHVGKTPLGKVLYSKTDSFIGRRYQVVKRRAQNKLMPDATIATASVPQHRFQKKNTIVLARNGCNYRLTTNLKTLTKLKGPLEQGKSMHLKQLNYKFRQMNRFKSISTKQYAACLVLKKSLQRSYHMKKANKSFCLFYNRFGKCKHGDKCMYIHDLEKVAVCTRFLQGTCHDKSCLFSHKVDPNKMPVCSYFLLGQCSRDNCAYRHVNVSQSAPVCHEFLKGYCSLADKCTKKHVLECEEFTARGACAKGKSCKLVHRVRRSRQRQRVTSTSGERRPRAFLQKKEPISSPFKDGNSHLLPSFLNENPNNYNSLDSVISRSLFMSTTTVLSDEAGPSNATSKSDFEFIPLASSDESGNESETIIRRRHSSFRGQDFISLE